uniref:Putative secreted protein n=1 Tax=Desmodus rotundus TaxID=9430 RepID=K9IW04_DESRO
MVHSFLPLICFLLRPAVQSLWRISTLSDMGVVGSIVRVRIRVKFLLQTLIHLAAGPVQQTSVAFRA